MWRTTSVHVHCIVIVENMFDVYTKRRNQRQYRAFVRNTVLVYGQGNLYEIPNVSQNSSWETYILFIENISAF